MFVGAMARSAATAAITTIARTFVGLVTWVFTGTAVPTPTDPDRIYVVPVDNRRVVIDADVRRIVIPLENRTVVAA
jgi:hypothetical protein